MKSKQVVDEGHLDSAADGYSSSVALNRSGMVVVGAPQDSEGNLYAGGSNVVRQPDGQGEVPEIKLKLQTGDVGLFGQLVNINEAGMIVVGAAGLMIMVQKAALFIFVRAFSGRT
ncbi:hypothetical protein [Pseudovibrio sp. Tun.PSC04-5.I4]|uniref:hypothetical protein n=1 Tax=Pseudovibrio sp. Tun.PSC04-5.I4 TaxID=1798213 RepID=UPI0008919A55|nr:hypothetical protein [Pseudovibrio sp. Tun.PSC04-5.I4]SDR19409.1 hypothetical protein SAMN04515695_3316 [Pseudovibrio sp. Tun.PSC04-5.I4]